MVARDPEVNAETGALGLSARVLRPSPSQIWRLFGTRGAVLWLGLTVLQVVAASNEGSRTLFGVLGTLVAIALLGASIAFAYLRRVKIELDPAWLVIQQMRGPAVSLPRSEIQGVALRDVRETATLTRPIFLIYDIDRRCRAVFDRRLWDPKAIDSLAAYAGSVQVESRATTNKGLETEYPGSVSAWRRHGVLIGSSIVFVGIAVAVIFHSS